MDGELVGFVIGFSLFSLILILFYQSFSKKRAAKLKPVDPEKFTIIDGPECPKCQNTKYYRLLTPTQVFASLIVLPVSLLILFLKYYYCTECDSRKPRF
jgi:hypothetical protein